MENLWAPWRLSYVAEPRRAESPGCFFCAAWAATGKEEEHLLLARGRKAFVMMNRYPYNSGHLMVAPVRHVGGVEEADPEEAAEIWALGATAKAVLAGTLRAEGCNLGINQGACAGAGVLDHLHLHVVPRWGGDTNFLAVLADTKVIPEALRDGWRRLRAAFTDRGFA